MREPDFSNLLAVLDRQKPQRPTLFELFLNEHLHQRYSTVEQGSGPEARALFLLDAWKNLGYDYATVYGCGMVFKPARSIS